MNKVIFWKEWRGVRWYFILFLLISIILPAFQTQSMRDGGQTARATLPYIWLAFTAILGFAFQSQQRSGRISFVLARPGTKPQLFFIHYLGHFLFLLILIVFSLLAHYVQLKIMEPQSELLNILFDPRLLFGLASCLLILIMVFFFATVKIVYGSAAAGAGVFFLLLVFGVFLNVPKLAERLLTLRPFDSPVSFLILVVFASSMLVAFVLWMTAFNEIRDRRNRRWFFPGVAALALTLLLSVPVIKAVAGALTPPLAEGNIEQIFLAQRHANYPLIGIVSNAGEKSIFKLRNPNPGTYRNIGIQHMAFRVSNVRIHCASSFSTSFYQPVSWQIDASKGRLLYLSNLPVWGQDIRTIGQPGVLSPRDYSRKESFGAPFLSPEGDRVAYLKTGRPLFGMRISRSVCITIMFHRLTGSLPLPDGNGIEYAGIGWTQDGNYFIFRKDTPAGSEVWAVDWLATELVQLPDFVTALAEDCDLQEIRETMNQEKFPQLPENIKDIARSYWGYACNLEREVLERELGQTILQYKRHKRSPSGLSFAIVAKPAPASGPKLGIYENHREFHWVLDDFTATEKQWGWFNDSLIIYAKGRELWQVDTHGQKTLITTVTALEKR